MVSGQEPCGWSGAAERALRRAFGFAEVRVVARLQGGYANDVFRVRADGEPVVLRVKRPPVIEADVAFEHRLLRMLAPRLPEVAQPIAARDGETMIRIGDRLGWLMPFHDGEPATPGREPHRLAAAHALGRLHQAGARVDVAPRPCNQPLSALEWPPLRVPDPLEDWRATIVRAREWAIDFVRRVARERCLPVSLIHGDFFPGNVLVSGDEVIAIIDWEEAQADWLGWELANALGTFCGVEDDLDREAARRFVAAYRAGGGRAPQRDDDLLLPLLRVKRTLEILRAPTDRDPRWEHQRANLRSLDKLPTEPARL
jgi:Ser/Thr protein kinase RdoA (MazF antagonist)